MPSILDEFLIEIGIDPKKTASGGKDVVEWLTKIESASNKTGKAVDAGAKKMGDSMAVVSTRLLEVATLFTGGLGITAFLGYIVKSTAELGRLGKVLDTSTQDLYAWNKVGEQVGAQNGEMAGSWQRLVHTFNDFAIGLPAANAKFIRFFAEQGVQFTDSTGKMRSMTEVYMQLAKVVEGMDPARAEAYLRGLGLSPGAINAILQGTARLTVSLDEMKKASPTPEQIRAAAAAQAAFNVELAKTESLGRGIATELLKPFNALLETVNKLASAIKGFFDDLDKASKSPLFRWLHGFGSTSDRIAGVPAEIERRRAAAGLPPGPEPQGGQGVGGSGTNFNDRFGTWPGISGARGAGSSGVLERERTGAFGDQLKDPALRREIAGMATLEGSPEATIESMFNRVQYINEQRAKRGQSPMSLREMLHSGFYGPINRGQLSGAMAGLDRNPRRMAQMNAAIDAAVSGNRTGGATDQGMPSDPNGMWPGGRKTIGGNVFNDWGGGPGGHAAAAAWREAQQRRAAGGGAAWGNNSRAVPWLTNPAAFALLPNGRSSSNTTNNSSTAETHVGSVTVQTHATDAYGIAKDFSSALEKFANVGNHNNGPN